MKSIIKFLIIAILFILNIHFVIAEPICEFDFFIYKNDTVQFHKINSYNGREDTNELKQSDYTLLFLDSANNIVDKIYLPVIFYVFDVPDGDVDSIPLSARKPCNSKWDTMNMLHNDKIIFTLNIKNLMCNEDRICNSYETYLTCPNDCPSGSKDGWCDNQNDDICDPDCIADTDSDCKEYIQSGVAKSIEESKQQTKEETKKSKLNINWLYISLPLILIFGLLTFIEIKRRKSHKEIMQTRQQQNISALRNYVKEQIRDALIKNNYNNQEIEEIFRRLE
ncbi:hypothetical protein HYX00_03045 [Candidatus Woesearchaeota archaeon]|nr:hypothetical protein [Candidatus Woesearchaeota archaeon]